MILNKHNLENHLGKSSYPFLSDKNRYSIAGFKEWRWVKLTEDTLTLTNNNDTFLHLKLQDADPNKNIDEKNASFTVYAKINQKTDFGYFEDKREKTDYVGEFDTVDNACSALTAYIQGYTNGLTEK